MIAFFDMFDYALTDWEIWRMLGVKCEFFEVVEALENMGSRAARKNGFYFFSGRDKNIIERLNRYNFADRKFKRAVSVSKIFRFIPWIKMIAVGNLLGSHNLKDGSDIDFFIVAEDRRIWLARFFCAGIAKIAGWRPKHNDSRDKICLSFYVSESALDLKGLMIKQKTDIYFIYWLAGLAPVYDAGKIYEKLIADNLWLKNHLPNWRPGVQSRQRRVKPFLSGFCHDAIDFLIGGLEPQFKKPQIKFLPPKLKNLMNKDTRVVVDDKIIKLHANDRREEYAIKYEKKIFEKNN